MLRAIWTALAATELDDILYYVSVRAGRPSTGEQIYYAIRALADDYARSAAPRHTHPDAPAGWYYFGYKRWLVFYRPHEEGIEVMRVIDGSRDLPSRFEDT